MNDVSDWRSDPFDNKPMFVAWEAVYASDLRIAEHIAGDNIDETISLTDCVAAFFAEAARGPIALIPEVLAAALGCFADGPFASRAGTKQFIEDVCQLWRGCHDSAMAAATKRRALAGILIDPWADLPPPNGRRAYLLAGSRIPSPRSPSPMASTWARRRWRS